MRFEFHSRGRIIFGTGVFSEIGKLSSYFSKKALIITGKKSFKSSDKFALLNNEMKNNNVDYVLFNEIETEPDIEIVDTIADIGLKNNVSMIIGIGGGSVIDTGKAVSGVLTNGGSVSYYMEGIGKELPLLKPSLPYIAVPTTAGTGAEVTKNAVIYSKEKNVKRSIRSPYLIPDIALDDPQLTINLTKMQTAYSGMDALTQLIESYVSKKAQPVTSALSIYGIELVGKSLVNVYNNGDDIKAREDMLLASLLSGLALSNSGLGAVHSLASSLGAFSIPHGKVCAILLPIIMKENLPYNMEKFAKIGIALTEKHLDSEKKSAYAGLDFIYGIHNKLNIPENLKEYKIKKKSIPEIIKNSGKSNMQANPKPFTDEELENLLEKIL